MARLSPRQKQCLRLVYQRRTSKEIAAELGLSPGTVHTYCAEAVALLDARNRRHAAELLAAAEQTGDAPAPSAVEPQSHGVPEPVSDPAPAGPGSTSPDWRWVLPIRPSGAAHNVLPVPLRLFWIVGLAVLLAIGFGSVMSGLFALSAFAEWLHR